MKTMWTMIDKWDMTAYLKSRLFIALNAVVGILVGLLCWLVIHTLALGSISWMLVFMTYPGFAMAVYAIYYLYNHEF